MGTACYEVPVAGRTERPVVQRGWEGLTLKVGWGPPKLAKKILFLF